jgi:hypothetical protein
MLHHACLLSALPVHTSPLAPRTSGWRCSAASVASASMRRGRSCAAAAASSALPAVAYAAREISSAKSGREHWAKGFVIAVGKCEVEGLRFWCVLASAWRKRGSRLGGGGVRGKTSWRWSLHHGEQRWFSFLGVQNQKWLDLRNRRNHL